MYPRPLVWFFCSLFYLFFIVYVVCTGLDCVLLPKQHPTPILTLLGACDVFFRKWDFVFGTYFLLVKLCFLPKWTHGYLIPPPLVLFLFFFVYYVVRTGDDLVPFWFGSRSEVFFKSCNFVFGTYFLLTNQLFLSNITHGYLILPPPGFFCSF